MATEPKKPAAPTAPPPKPVVAPEKRANAAIELAGKKGHRWWKPFRYSFEFAKGAILGAVDGTAKWGKRGMWAGVIFALGVGLMTGGAGSLLYPMLMMGATGFVSGAAIGGVGGLVAGGLQGMGRQYRAEKYADDLVVKEKAKTEKPLITPDYRTAYRHQQRGPGSYYQLDRIQQQQRELEQEVASHSWQDRVMGMHGGGGRGW